MRRRPRAGRRGRPDGGWPLDRVFVGPAALRATRELFYQEADRRSDDHSARAWDLSLWSGVSPQSSDRALRRMRELGLVDAILSNHPCVAAAYRLDRTHPLVPPLDRLFRVERGMVPRPRPFARSRRRG